MGRPPEQCSKVSTGFLQFSMLNLKVNIVRIGVYKYFDLYTSTFPCQTISIILQSVHTHRVRTVKTRLLLRYER